MLRIRRRVKENPRNLPAAKMDVREIDSPYSFLEPNAQTVNPNQGYHQLLMILRPESRTQTTPQNPTYREQG
jgi:hypothetical protein